MVVIVITILSFLMIVVNAFSFYLGAYVALKARDAGQFQFFWNPKRMTPKREAELEYENQR